MKEMKKWQNEVFLAGKWLLKGRKDISDKIPSSYSTIELSEKVKDLAGSNKN